MKPNICTPWMRRIVVIAIWAMAGGEVARANPEVYEKALTSTGWLINPREKNTAMGTCWIADRERKLVITSAHLIGESGEVLVYFPCRVEGKVMASAKYYLGKTRTINGRVVAQDQARDLALIQLDGLPDDAKELKLAKDSARPGDDVHSIGNSGLASKAPMLWRYTRGNVRQVYTRKLKSGDGATDVQLVETQSPVNMGDSGGPVLNDHGEVVGVAAAYDPAERLVSQNIDVTEVRSFLTTAVPKLQKSEAPPRAAFSLVGSWNLSAKADGDLTAHGLAEFKSDGTYQLSDSDTRIGNGEMQEGRFACANGMLLLMTEDGQATLKLTWNGKDRFSGTTKGVELHFDR